MSSGASGQPRDYGPVNTHAAHDLGYGKYRGQKLPTPGPPNHKPTEISGDHATKLSLQSKAKEKDKGAKARRYSESCFRHDG